MSEALAESYAVCRSVARRSSSNFYYSFLLLPRVKRRAMCALYAYLRHTDDLGDSPQPAPARRCALQAWRRSLDRAIEGACDDPLLPALVDAVQRFQIPVEHLYAVIDGVEMDLDRARYETFTELEQYCHRVASSVGLSCIHIWGFTGPEALRPAARCGLAFQMTNILRDLKEDAAADRVYLPLEDLRQFDYGVDELKRGVRDERFRALMQFEVQRTRRLYQEGLELNDWLEPQGRRIFGTMIATYRELLRQIERLEGDVLIQRAGVSGWRKFRIAARSLLLTRGPEVAPPAGTGPP